MTNVKLSKEELALVCNADFILTKNRIIQKVYDLFGKLCDEFRTISTGLPETLLVTAPKISKGENYLGLPWVMLDFPRNFSTTDVMAIRCFFWWGNFFSITLQLQGHHQEQYAPELYRFAEKGNWWICNDASERWQHHFNEGYYVPFTPASAQERPFIKLAKKIPLQEWDNVFVFYRETYQEIISCLSAQPVK